MESCCTAAIAHHRKDKNEHAKAKGKRSWNFPADQKGWKSRVLFRDQSAGPDSCPAQRSLDRLVGVKRILVNTMRRSRAAYRGNIWRTFCPVVLGAFFAAFLAAGVSHAQNATWLLTPGSNDWSTTSNWTPATVPSSTAIFGASNTTTITNSDFVTIGTLQFNTGAPAYIFNPSGLRWTINGAGIVNNSSNAPTINVSTEGFVIFASSSSAGNAIIPVSNNGFLVFQDSSTAGNSTLTASTGGGINFENNGTAGSATIITNNGGFTGFIGSSMAGSANITTNNGGETNFSGSSTAGSAAITVNAGGLVKFLQNATGGQARLIANAGGIIDLSGLDPAGGMTAGSIEGGGTYDLGSNALTVGLNNLSTTVSGTIADGGASGGTGASLIKDGTGTLTFTGTNTYSGTTNVNAGTLLVDGSLGAGLVTVASGATLGGTGTIGGPVTIQNGGILGPGDAPGTLTTGTLTLNSGSISNYELGTPNGVGGVVNDVVIVNGNLTLAGTLNVANAGGFGSGVYRLFNYSGSLTNDGLTVSTVPAGFTPEDFLVHTTRAGQVDLLVSATGFGTQYWDGTNTVANGTIHGGNSTWDNVTTNWTNADATVNAPWQRQTAIFEGAAGTVTLGDNIQFNEMEFLITGYRIVAAGAQTLIAAAAATIDVGSGVTATIAAPIVDGSSSASITKTDLGILILSGANAYTGGTTITAGTLQIGFGGTTGRILGNVTDDAALVFDESGSMTFGGVISGTGTVTQNGNGTLILTVGNVFTGGTVVNAGTLQVGDGTGPASLSGSNGAFPGGAGTDAVTVNNSARINVMANATVSGGAGGEALSGGGTGGNGGTGGEAVSLSRGGTFTNSGIISGGDAGDGGVGGASTVGTGGTGGTGGDAVSFGIGGSLTNTGTISGGAGGEGGSGNINTGDLGNGAGGNGGTGGNTISFDNGGSLTNRGTISGGAGGEGGIGNLSGAFEPGNSGAGGTGGQGGDAVSFSNGGTLTNNGMIFGGAGGQGGISINFNDGNGGTGGDAVSFSHGGTLTNSGTISGGAGGAGNSANGGNGGDAVSFIDGGTLNNSGTISGGAGGQGGGSSVGSNGGDAVSFSSTGSVINSGTISGGAAGFGNGGASGRDGFGVVFSGGAGKLTNQSTGVINGGVTMVNLANIVTLDAGSVINGILNIGTNTAATLTLDGTGTQLYSAAVTGATTFNGALIKNGTGTWTLDESLSYTGGTTINAGTLQIGNGGTSGGIAGKVIDNAALVFDRSGGVTFGGIISGTGTLTQSGSGILDLTAANTYSGSTNVNAGTLLVDGSLGAGLVTVASGATLGGRGTIGGPVTIQNGGILAPGDSPGTLTLGTLTLNSGSISNYELGTPNMAGGGVNDLVIVNGNLNLAGTLNIVNAGGFGSGVYRLFNYTGSLTNNGLTLTTIPAGFAPGDLLVQTSRSGQVNLLVSASGFATQYWDGTNTVADGTIHGGSGTWDNVTTNWTNVDATVSAPWQSQTAIFEGTAGTVTLGANIQFSAMEFLITGYTIVAPGAQTLIAATAATIDVASGVTAIIAAPIVDGSSPASITKTDLGILILSGANAYTGGTTISAGTLQIGNGSTTGGVEGDITDNAALVFDRSDSVTYNGTISGTGTLTQSGNGTLKLSGTNTNSGNTNVNKGTLLVDGSLGASAVNVASGATFGGSGTIGGAVTVQNGGTLAPGDSVGTLTVGTLTLSTGSISSYELGTPNVVGGEVNDLVQVNGNLTLSGILNVSNAGGFSEGVYRLFNYTGSLTNDGLTVNLVPIGFTPSDFLVRTAQAGQVDLLVSTSGFSAQYWDGTNIVANGTIHGGNGTWDNVTTNWTNVDATDNAPWESQTAIFQGAAGTVTLGNNIQFSTMEFMTTGYSIVAPGALKLRAAAATTIDVGSGLSATIAAPIVDGARPALITKTGLGTLILTGTNAYTGGTTIAFGTLQIGSGGTAGSIVGNVIDNGSLVFDRSDSVTFGGPISGSGNLTQNGGTGGTGTLILTGADTYTGGTTISAGTLQLGNATTTGSIAGTVVNKSTFDIVKAATTGITAITTTGGGTTEFENGSTAGTATIVNDNAGTTSFLNQSGAGNAAITNSGDGFTEFHDSSTAGNATIVNGLQNRPIGVTEFSDVSTAGNASITNNVGGVTEFLNSTSAGGATVTTNNEGRTDFEAASTAGSAIVVTNNGGETDFIDTSTGAQARLVTNAGGIVDISGLSSTGMTAGSIEGSGTYLLGSKTLTVGLNNLSTTVSGTIAEGSSPGSTGGALIKVGSGTLTFTGTNTYRGGTSFNGGVVAVNSDSNLGTGSLSFNGGALEALATGGGITSNKVIALNPGGGTFLADTGTRSMLSGTISGPGSLTQTGGGTLILSGTNTYSGGTIVNAGTLTVNNAQALGFGNVVVNGGTLRADPQPINVKGNYTQNAAGTLQLQLAGAQPGQYDSLNVNGRAALGGTLQLIALNGFEATSTDRFTLVIASGGISGKFADLLDPFSAVVALRLIYGSNTVVLGLSSNFALFAPTPNERAGARLLDVIQFNPKVANLISFLDTRPLSSLPGDLAEISPDALSAFYEISFSNANIQRLNLEGRLDDVRAGSNGFSSNMKLNGASTSTEGKGTADGKGAKSPVEPVLQPTPENRWGVWVTGFGDFVNVDSDDNGHGYDFTTGGVSVGLDYRITDQLAIGVLGEYAHTWTSLKPSGDIDVDSGRGGVYATWFSHGIYLNGAIYGGHNVYSSSRSTLGGMASGGTGGAEYSTFISGGYDVHVGNLSVGPVASLQYTDVGIDSFSEHGSLAPMAIHSQSAESLRSDFGFRASYLRQVGNVLVEPSVRAAWEHEYKYSALPITAGFAGIPGPSGTFVGPSEGHDSAILSAGISVQWTPMIATYINYDGQFGRDRYDSNAVTGGVRISL
jgi:fibronectin-binding autotransporter adhesin